jgi:hypothetical protein
MPDNPQSLANNRLTTADRRTKVCHLYMRGVPVTEIAVQVGASVSRVKGDLAWHHAYWVETAAIDFDLAKGRELEKINALEEEAWAGFRRSQTRSVRTTRRRDRRTGGEDGEQTTDVAGVQEYERDGNTAWMDTIKWCIDRRIKLLGLDAPTQIHVTNADEDQQYRAWYQSLTPEARMLVDASHDALDTTARPVATPESAPPVAEDHGGGTA